MGAEVRTASMDFKVPNFAATCGLVETKSDLPDSRELSSGPILSVGVFQFGIEVQWFTKAVQPGEEDMDDSEPDLTKSIQFWLTRCDSREERCAVRLLLQLVNQDPGKTFTVMLNPSNENFHSMRPGVCLGQLHQTDKLKFGKIIDSSEGWLHHGALWIRAVLNVAVSITTTAPRPPRPTTARSLADNLKALLDSGELADVTIIAGDTRLPAHLVVLSARSPVFHAMFSSQMQEAFAKEVVINDVELEPLKSFLQYVYTDTVDEKLMSDDVHVAGLLEVAHRYEVPSLVERCIHILSNRLSTSTVALMLEIADAHNFKDFKTACLDFIRPHLKEVQRSETFSQLVDRRPRLLKDILAAVAPPAEDEPMPKKRARRGRG